MNNKKLITVLQMPFTQIEINADADEALERKRWLDRYQLRNKTVDEQQARREFQTVRDSKMYNLRNMKK